MLVERTNNHITITVTAGVNNFVLQRLIDYVNYIELTSKSKAKQADIDNIADKVNAQWWLKNNKKLIG
jgi:hypothetical protein